MSATERIKSITYQSSMGHGTWRCTPHALDGVVRSLEFQTREGQVANLQGTLNAHNGIDYTDEQDVMSLCIMVAALAS